LPWPKWFERLTDPPGLELVRADVCGGGETEILLSQKVAGMGIENQLLGEIQA
jgi:hypothetical protein